jgi:predicted membrane channel-forming protein YqfA (hemolysin III family)
MKYLSHPQKFDNPDPLLQQQWLDLKEVLCDNPHMIGYIIMIGQSINPRTVLHILTTIHTDTANIWTHIVGAIFFFSCASLSLFPISIIAVGAALTCCLSAIYHTLRNYSRKMYDICLCLDVSSIAIQIFATLLADVINLFGKDHVGIARLDTVLVVVMAVVTIAGVPIVLKRKLYWVRTFVFSCESVLCIPLFVQKYLIDGFDERWGRVIGWRVLCLATAGLGIAVRSAHVPERFFPRSVFQSLLHSHCIFHLLSIVSSYFSVLSAEAEL